MAKRKAYTDYNKEEIMDLFDRVEDCVIKYEKTNSCYFWKNNGNAASRRSKDNYYSHYDTINFDGIEYDFSLSMDIRCQNAYRTLDISVDGEQKTMRAINSLYKRLLEIRNAYLEAEKVEVESTEALRLIK